MSDVVIKIFLLLAGLLVGFFIFRGKEAAANRISKIVFNLLLPYVILLEVSSAVLTASWWWYIFLGAAFVLVPFAVGRFIIRLPPYRALLLATAEGGSMGFVVYVIAGNAPITHFLLVDMIGNGLSLFLIIFPLLTHRMGGKHENNATLVLLVAAMVVGMTLNILGVPLLKLEAISALSILQPWVTAVLVLFIAIIIGGGIVTKLAKEIFTSTFFVGFWVYRIALLAISIGADLPLAVIVLAILPPSFMVPIFYRMHAREREAIYATNFIASCMPISMTLATGLIIFG
jgi:hypothetical protein